MKVIRRSVGMLFEDYTVEITAEEIIKILMDGDMYIVMERQGILHIDDYDGYME